MTQTAVSPYAHMSRSELIAANEKKDQTLQAFYTIIHQQNKKMSPGEKLLLIAARCILPQEKPNERGLVRLPYDKAADFIGMSESSANRYGNALTERYNATNEPVPYTTKKGQDCILTYVKPDDPLWNEPWNIDLPEEKERTINANIPCPRCRSEGTYRVVKKHVIAYQEIRKCSICNYKEVSEVIPENDPLTPTEKGVQAGEPFGEEEKAQTSDTLTSINSHPIAHEVKKVSSLNTFLLERIGNPEQKLIVATGKAAHDAKYISLPLDHTPDIEKYLAGDLAHIYGSGLADKDGMTYQVEWDIDTPEEYEHHAAYQKELARAGISSLLFHRANFRAHLIVRFSEKVNAEATKAYCLAACPKLAEIEECYPTGGKHNGRISWPFYQRRGDTVTACPVDIVLASDPGEVIKHPGIKSQPMSLPWQIERAINDATLIPALPVVEQPQMGGRVLLDISSPAQPFRLYDDGLRTLILAQYRDLPWPEVVQGEIKNNRFCASWRGEDKPSVVIKGDYTTDYGRTQSGSPECHDKFDVYWLTRGKNPRAELKRLIDEEKQQREDIAS